MMKRMWCQCNAEIDLTRNSACSVCGFPKCSDRGCMVVQMGGGGCMHVFGGETHTPARMRKRLRTACDEGAIEYFASSIQCLHCEQRFCEECCTQYAVRYVGYEFTPANAYRYSHAIVNAALGLYLVNKRITYKEKLPKALLNHIISFL